MRNLKIATLIGTTQNNLLDTGRFTRRRKFGKRRYPTFRSVLFSHNFNKSEDEDENDDFYDYYPLQFAATLEPYHVKKEKPVILKCELENSRELFLFN